MCAVKKDPGREQKKERPWGQKECNSTSKWRGLWALGAGPWANGPAKLWAREEGMPWAFRATRDPNLGSKSDIQGVIKSEPITFWNYAKYASE